MLNSKTLPILLNKRLSQKFYSHHEILPPRLVNMTDNNPKLISQINTKNVQNHISRPELSATRSCSNFSHKYIKFKNQTSSNLIIDYSKIKILKVLILSLVLCFLLILSNKYFCTSFKDNNKISSTLFNLFCKSNLQITSLNIYQHKTYKQFINNKNSFKNQQTFSKSGIFVPSKFITINKFKNQNQNILSIQVPNLYQKFDIYEPLNYSFVQDHDQVIGSAVDVNLHMVIDEKPLGIKDHRIKSIKNGTEFDLKDHGVWIGRYNSDIHCSIIFSKINHCDFDSKFYVDVFNETFYKFYKHPNIDHLTQSMPISSLSTTNLRSKRQTDSNKKCQNCICNLSIHVDASLFINFANSNVNTVYKTVVNTIFKVNNFYTHQKLENDNNQNLNKTQYNEQFWNATLGIKSLEVRITQLFIDREYSIEDQYKKYNQDKKHNLYFYKLWKK